MRSFRHWTPRYVAARIAEARYHRAYPDLPWLTTAANEILTHWLRPSDVGLEFGSGRSTLWLSSRMSRLTSVEHDEAWYRRVRAGLEEAGRTNVELLHAPKDYLGVFGSIGDGSVDFVLVDGMERDRCATEAIRVLRPGALLVIDNVNWYLPSDSHAPASRRVEQGPDGPVWSAFVESVAGWRRVWTSSGVTDTALFFKPCATAPRA